MPRDVEEFSPSLFLAEEQEWMGPHTAQFRRRVWSLTAKRWRPELRGGGAGEGPRGEVTSPGIGERGKRRTRSRPGDRTKGTSRGQLRGDEADARRADKTRRRTWRGARPRPKNTQEK